MVRVRPTRRIALKRNDIGEVPWRASPAASLAARCDRRRRADVGPARPRQCYCEDWSVASGHGPEAPSQVATLVRDPLPWTPSQEPRLHEQFWALMARLDSDPG